MEFLHDVKKQWIQNVLVKSGSDVDVKINAGSKTTVYLGIQI